MPYAWFLPPNVQFAIRDFNENHLPHQNEKS